MLRFEPSQDLTDALNLNNININKVYFDHIHNNIRYTNSNKITDMVNSIQSYYWDTANRDNLQNTLYFATDLMFRVVNDPTKVPYFAGASCRITQENYNTAQNNNQTIQQLLINAGIHTPYRGYSRGTKCIYFVYVNSGFSILKNFINAHNEIERNTTYENLINNYRKNNISNEEQTSTTIVLNNIWPVTDNMQDNITILTNKLSDLKETLIALVMTHAHYARALCTNNTLHQSVKDAIEKNNPDITLQQKLCYYLTEFWETELAEKHELSVPLRTTNHNHQKNMLEAAYELILEALASEGPKVFLQNLTERYNYDYKRKEEDRLTQINNALKSYYQNIQDLEHEKHVLQRKLLTMTAMQPEEIAEFWDAIKLYKNIQINSITNTALLLTINSALTFYDEEDAKTILNNPNSAIIRELKELCNYNDLEYDIVKMILFDIFINKKHQIHTYSRFKISISSNGGSEPISITKENNPSGAILNGKLYQPHIMQYNCYEAARTQFYKGIHNKQFTAAFGQLVGATQNLTISDTTVFSHLLHALFERFEEAPTIFNTETQTYHSARELYLAKIEEVEKFENENKLQEASDE